MSECPLADDCPRYSERISGMGCQYYGDRGGAEWCSSYDQPIQDLKAQPVKPGEEVVVDVDDIHESGAGVGRTDDGFIVLIDGLLPTSRAIVRIDRVKSNHATAKKIVERLPVDDDSETADETDSTAGHDDESTTDNDSEINNSGSDQSTALGSRDNFWGG
ncbi:TRAM domain-containing protein [Haloquadratum walsbyi]|jgi:predicted RNA-binding protein with TRAM domain|uniref:TRAM domain protein n=1 Tax=Haloquadratum walsbyi (strain DSM 16790 / HBSQ001) TaxID=362976 RepID=Q18FA2_HALWD|nr:TRAM domain-containing protein [Haloquadratum walsbyi]CAJ53356.1 TRAM domain protein [Haloquadratum walsbyi DSM 16790]